MSIERDLINQMLGKENLVYDDSGNLVSEEEMFGKKLINDEVDAEYTQEQLKKKLIAPDYTGSSAEQYTEGFTNRPSDAGSIEEAQSAEGMLGSFVGQLLPPVDIANAIIAASENKWTHAIVTAAGFGAGLKYGRQGLAMLRNKLADIADLAQKGSKAAGKQLDKIRKALDTYPEATGADNITNPSLGWEKKMEPLLNVLEKDLDAVTKLPKNVGKIIKKTDAIDSEAFKMVKGTSTSNQIKNVSSQFRDLSKELDMSTNKMKDVLDRSTPYNLVVPKKSSLSKPLEINEAIRKETSDFVESYLSKDVKKSIGLDPMKAPSLDPMKYPVLDPMRTPRNMRDLNKEWQKEIGEALDPSKYQKGIKIPPMGVKKNNLTHLDKAIGGMTLTDVINRSVTGYEEE